MGKVEENKQQKKTRLMDTAFYLFTTKGFARTTIADIVHEADLAKGTFYLYFRDKYELQERLVAWKSEELFNHAIAFSNYQEKETPADKVLAIIDDILDQVSKQPNLLRFINKNLSWGLFRRAVEHVRIDFTKIFQEILGIEDIKKLEVVVYTIIELVSSTCHSVILEQDPVDIEQYKPYLYQIIRGIVEIQP